MAWRIVVQPDGKYARFSEVVDDFTHIDMTREEAVRLCRWEIGHEEGSKKVARADADPGRYAEAARIIAAVHGHGRDKEK